MTLFNNLKEYLAKKKIRKALSQAREVHYPDFKKVKTMLLLFETDENGKNEIVSNAMKNLQRDGKQVSAWGFIPVKQPDIVELFGYTLFGINQLTFAQLPNHTLLSKFKRESYDMVLVLTTRDIYPLDYLLAVAKSPFKVSKTKPYKGISDFMIELDKSKNEQFLFDQILFYLNSIQAKD